MFLKHHKTGHLIEVANITELTNPCLRAIRGYAHWGEEVQAEETYNKQELLFTSGEHLPHCWVDPNFSDHRPRITPKSQEAEAAGYHGA